MVPGPAAAMRLPRPSLPIVTPDVRLPRHR